MKKIYLLSLLFITLFDCSSSSDSNIPNLAFTIENGNRFASSEINVINTSTNYNGTYIWEVTTSFGTETYNTTNLNFIADRVSDYSIKLKTNSNEYETEQTISITQPGVLQITTLTLQSIPQDYETLFFVMGEVVSDGLQFLYSSDLNQNVQASDPMASQWTIGVPGNLIPIADASNSSDLKTYQIWFYDNVSFNTITTKLETFTNEFDANSQYIPGQFELITTTNNCDNCQYFEVIIDYKFKD